MKLPTLTRIGCLTMVSACLLAVGVPRATAQPTLQMEPTAAGQIVSWDKSLGFEYRLYASDDLVTWTELDLPVVQKVDRQQVTVPLDMAKEFYQLVKADGAPIKRAYVGSETCRTCHPGKYNSFIQSGHPYKLNKVNGGPPTYPFTEVTNTPAGFTWDDVTYVIGGANWKARFIDNQGYIITGTNVQWNLETGEWVGYHASDPLGTKPYDCGTCHTTGWVPTENRGGHQDGLPGMHGSFVATGIQCEECHGPGSEHIKNFPADIVKDTSSAMCGSCHVRGATNTIPASGGFIRHHEQYNEMLSAGHAVRKCVDCHDPHVTTRHGQVGGIIRECTDCHDSATYTPADVHGFVAECTDCHMPKASKSAAALNKYTGDIHTHIFKINPAADGEMFNAEGFANGSTGVTLQYICYKCHQDPEGIGGSGSTKTLEQLSAKATGFHNQ